MSDAASLPLDCARNPRELALLRMFRLIPEEKRAEAVDKLTALVEELRHRKKPKARQD